MANEKMYYPDEEYGDEAGYHPDVEWLDVADEEQTDDSGDDAPDYYVNKYGEVEFP